MTAKGGSRPLRSVTASGWKARAAATGQAEVERQVRTHSSLPQSKSWASLIGQLRSLYVDGTGARSTPIAGTSRAALRRQFPGLSGHHVNRNMLSGLSGVTFMRGKRKDLTLCPHGSALNMSEAEPPIDIEQFLDRMQPPGVPEETAVVSPALVNEIRQWNRTYAVKIIAGLLTEPRLHANDIRLDWLLRLVIAKAHGKRKPGRDQLSTVLNSHLVEARVERLEDPIEDLFCDHINTAEGSYRILLGRWEAAAPYAQTVYDAFATLPEHELKQSAMHAVHALLRLSNALAERSSLSRDTDSAGEPAGTISLPNKERLEQLARRVRFSRRALGQLGINPEHLSRFILKDEHFRYVTDREAGDTPLEFHPLLQNGEVITVVAPSNISLAVRAVLIGAAVFGKIEKTLQWRLLEQQERYSEATGFWPVPHIHLSPPNEFGMRASVCSFAPGRFLHIVQLPVQFDGFPAGGFAECRRLSADTNKFLGARPA